MSLLAGETGTVPQDVKISSLKAQAQAQPDPASGMEWEADSKATEVRASSQGADQPSAADAAMAAEQPATGTADCQEAAAMETEPLVSADLCEEGRAKGCLDQAAGPCPPSEGGWVYVLEPTVMTECA